MKASVVVLTKNPGSIFRRVLLAAMNQKTDFDYEILVIDSGSTDGTVEFVTELLCNKVRLHRIESTEFGHGRTRNLGVTLTSGEFVAFLTHDAIPASDDWLAQLVATAEVSEDIAGVFGRHVAHDDADEFTRRELLLHFSGFSSFRIVRKADDEDRYANDLGYRQVLHFFSDNNALIRRAVWQSIPYPDVDFAEDQAWAKMIIEAGYAKAYAEFAVVQHSHNYGLFERLQRSFDESYALLRLFGYNLCPGMKHLRNSWHALNRRDYHYLLSLPKLSKFIRLKMYCRAVVDNLMRLLGHYLGSKGGQIPSRARHWLSRDRRLLNNLIRG